MKKILQDPLAHFLVLGLGLFVLFDLVASDDAAYDSRSSTSIATHCSRSCNTVHARSSRRPRQHASITCRKENSIA